MTLLAGRAVAVKVLPATADQHHADRFRHEAQVVSQLTDPHIVEVLDTGGDGGRLYLAMRLVDGIAPHRLRDRAAARPRGQRSKPRRVIVPKSLWRVPTGAPGE